MRHDWTRINPSGLHETSGYHHVTIAPAGRLAFLAGQCPLDAEARLVGAGDVDAQVDQVAANSAVALRAAGARPWDVVRSVVYIASADSATLGRAWHRFAEESLIAEAFGSASTLLGIATLGYSGQLVELDLTAMLPN